MKKIIKLVSLSFFFLSNLNIVLSQSTETEVEIRGKVFLDINKNGIIDKNEKRISKVLISNGIDIIETDKHGNYTLCIKKGQSLFPILSSKYKLITKQNSNIINANYLFFHPDSLIDVHKSYDFLIQPNVVKNKFTIGAIGDIQIDNSEELNYAAKSIGTELSNSNTIDFNIILGDLVNDKLDLLDNVKSLLEKTQTPSWALPGNHDRNVNNESAMNTVFNQKFGADTYAFNCGKVHFIVLNNVYSTGKRNYEGRISADQLLFIKNDLSHVDKKTTLVISQHIPMYGTKNREELFKILEGYDKVLILSGHTHVVSRHVFSNGNIQEIGAGATCGTWWRGEKNSEGIPEALMQCGTPRGYFVIDFDHTDYSFKYKVVGLDESKQMSLSLDSNQMVANIFGASDSTLVQYKINDGEWKVMKKNRMVDPYVSQIVKSNKSKIYPTLNNTVNPLRARASNHIWTAEGDFSVEKQPISITIKAEDKFGFSVQEEFLLFQ
ncbi:calcineurin-like phosphoesterase C-terminal domain-containing protein [Sphingobacterium bovistauri]|uniref:Calcineurin-like phosphoesterase C-terminal domain-containing protein n=1 Tax=Sphingobacterium bovistauri TaxID=2781959 RepID=A0ABS7Z8W1_9SPHI|nr:calcineurin-like phosphoesterase C-terminal domain-containing protein [Sphingobacterium bovistauri]MCA5006628.1 calcineurin-like phosphoesterase C-terminal domain-containing protein [Sphingobacterium bovistauri]